MEFLIEPRLAIPPTAGGELVVKAPPNVPRDVPGNLLAKLMPVAMVVATVGMMAFYFTSGASAMRNPMFMFFPVMMSVSLLGTMVSGARGGNRSADVNQNRRDYLRYLASLDSMIVNTIQDQRLSLSWSHPHPAVLWTLVGGRRMWERRSDDADFGHARIGSGSRRLATPLVMPELGSA
ncbi:MAG: type VII secretion protein EccC, partial [Mycobacterium sp.]